MNSTTTQIRSYLDQNFPIHNLPPILTSNDLSLKARLNTTHQYIFGITRANRFSVEVDCENYKRWMREELAEVGISPSTTGWSFKGEQINEAKEILNELSVVYHANLEVEKIIGKLNLKRGDDENWFFIVVTIIPIQYFTIE